MRRLTILIALMLAGCGVQYQQTPEPDETDRVDAIAEELGTQLTYNSKTLTMNPEPEGLLFRRWVHRRAETLDGELPVYKLPALQNPGTVKATLEWERETARKEASATKGWMDYLISSSRRGPNCSKSATAETQWLESYKREHARGKHNSLLDWSATNARFQSQCDEEMNAAAELQEDQRLATEAAESEFRSAEEACSTSWKVANAAYNEAPSVERGRALTEASQRMKECMQGIGTQPPRDNGEGF